MKKALPVIGALAIGAAMTTSAEAHTFGAHGAGFVSGFSHPFTGLDHLLAMITVGIWAVQRGGRAVWAMPLTFVAAMLGGGALSGVGVPLPGVELGIAASLMLFGTVVALAFRPPLWLGVAMIAAFAIFHGYAHASEMPLTAAPVLYAVGFVVATALLHGIGIVGALLAVRRFTWARAGERSLRYAGGAVAGYGLFAVLS